MSKPFSLTEDSPKKESFMNTSVLLTIALTILIQSFTIVWWASSLSTRVETLETWVKDNRSLPTMIHRLDERFENLRLLVERLVKLLESK